MLQLFTYFSLDGRAFTALLTTARARTSSLGVDTDVSTADVSPILDVKSTIQGVLIPRMMAQPRDLMGSPF